MLVAWSAGRRDALVATRVTLLAGVFARVALLAVPAFTTNDVDRYLWDGAVSLAGFDPYLTAPHEAVLAELHGRWPTPPEHAAYPTLYPPVALALFALCASAGPELAPWLWKLAVLGASLGTLVVMLRLLERLQLERHFPLIALSPILVLEGGVGAHVDVFTTFCIALALLLASRRQALLCGAFLGLGAAIKLLPAVAVIPLAIGAGARSGWRIVGSALAAMSACYAAAVAVGWHPVGSLPLFVERWRFGAPLHSALDALLPSVIVGVVLSGAVLLALGYAAWRARRDAIGGMQVALAAPLLFGPVVFPWYVAALLPGLALQPRAWLLAWVSTLPLTYEVVNQFNAAGLWAPARWPLWIIALAITAGAAFDWQRRLSKPGYSFRLQS